MTELERVQTEVLEALRELSLPERREASENYIPTSMEVLGVPMPDLKALIRELRRKYNQWSKEEWIRLCKSLVTTNVFECQVVAFERIARDRKLLDALNTEDLDGLGINLDNWASVDHYSVGIFGVLWGKGVVPDERIAALIQSENLWERRVGVVSTVALNLKSRGGMGDTPRTLWVCGQVVEDHRDMIQKALSWALRELSKRDRMAVEEFLEMHESRLARRVIREVRHKLDFGTKN